MAPDFATLAAALTCDAFPNEDNNSHVFLSGLITAAVATAAVSFTSAAFAFSLATDAPQLSGRTASLRWGIRQRLLMGAAPWTTAASASRAWSAWRALKLRSAATWSSSTPKLVLFHATTTCTAVARHALRVFGRGTAADKAVDAMLTEWATGRRHARRAVRAGHAGDTCAAATLGRVP